MANEIQVEISIEEREALRALTRLTQQVDKTADDAKKSFNKMDAAVASFVGNLGANVAGKAIGAFTSAVDIAIDSQIDFEKAITEVNTLLPQSKKLTNELTQGLIDLSSEFGVDKATQAKAFYQVISSGAAQGAEAVELLRAANVLASSGLAELGDSVNILTDIINVYGAENITAQQASDYLFQTVKLGKTTIGELSTSIGQVLPAAQRLGIGLDEVGASLATLTTQGLSTSQRVTQLNALFTALFRNGGDAGKMFGKEIGDAFSLTALRAKGLEKFLQDLNTATGGNEETLVKLLGRTEAAQAVFGLTGNAAQSLSNNLADMAGAAGAATEAAKENQSTFSGQWAIAVEKVSNLIGEKLGPALNLATSGLKLFNAFMTDTPEEKIKKTNELKKEAIDLERTVDRLSTKSFLTPSMQQQLSNAQERLSMINKEIAKAESKAASSLIDMNRGASKSDPIAEAKSVNEKEIALEAEKAEVLKQITADRISAENELARLQFEVQKGQRDSDIETRVEEYELEKELKLLRDEERVAQEATTQEKLKELDLKYKGEKLQRDAKFQKDEDKAKDEAAKKDEKRRQQKLQAEQQLSQATVNIASNSAALITAISGKETKAAFLISKSAAAAQIIIDTQRANMLARAQLGTFAEPVVIRQTIAGGIALGTVAATTLQGLADGGIIGQGATRGGDNMLQPVRTGEMVLNADQQEQVFKTLSGGGIGGEIVIQIDGREIARAVRDQRQQGFAV